MNQAERMRRQIELIAVVIGFINILIFGYIVGNNGIAYLSIAYTSVSLVGAFVSGGVSDTLGKMLRVRNGKGQYRNVLCIRKRVLILQGFLGALCGIGFAAGAGALAQRLFEVPYVTLLFLLLAPTLLLRGISAVLIGFFQGEGTELPGAVAAPLRQIILLGLGLLFANIFKEYGRKVSDLLGQTAYTAMYGGVGIVVAMLLAELFVLGFLCVVLLGGRRSIREKQKDGMKQTDSWFHTVRVLYSAMWIPITLRILEMLPAWIGILFYGKSMADKSVYAENLGMLFGKYLVLCGIVVLLFGVLVFGVNTRTINALKKDDIRSAKAMFQSGLHLVLVNGIFGAVFVAVAAPWLSNMLGGTGTDVLTDLFRYGSVIVLFGLLYFYFSGLLLYTGKKYYLLGVTAVADVVFILLVTVLLNAGKAGILSLVYGAIAAFVLGSLLLGFLCCKLLHVGMEWLQVLAIPAGAAAVVGLVCMLLGKGLFPHLGGWVTVLVCLVLALLMYWAILLLARSFREQELKYMPGGRLIHAAGRFLHVFEIK